MRLLHFFSTTKVFIAITFLVVLAATPVFAGQVRPLQEKLAALEKLPSKFSFVVLGDNRAGDPACDAVYQKVLAAALERKPDLIINTGDQINRPGNLDDWKRFWQLSKAVTVPYFSTVGNHDIQIGVGIHAWSIAAHPEPAFTGIRAVGSGCAVGGGVEDVIGQLLQSAFVEA